MLSPFTDIRAALGAIVQEYHQRGDVPRLLEQVATLAQAAPSDQLLIAVEPFRDMHEVAGPIYEVIAEREPNNAKVLVALANAYWLSVALNARHTGADNVQLLHAWQRARQCVLTSTDSRSKRNA